MLREVFDKNSYLVLGIGGGGDIVSVAVLAMALKRCGYRVAIGGIAWERFVVDPVPGPIGLDDIRNPVEKGENYVLVSGESYAVRNDRKIYFQAARVASVLGEPVAVFDLYRGVNGYRKGIEEFMARHGFDGVIGLDVGGDVLATGFEEDLWSPLADAAGLAVLKTFKGSILAIHSPGADGELLQDYVLERIALVCRLGGCLGAYGLTIEDVLLLDRLTKVAVTEAGRIALLAFKGYYGEYPVRKGTRTVRVSPINTVMFFLDALKAYYISYPAKIADNTWSFNEIVNKLNNAGIYTEYNLEIDIARSQASSPEEIIRIRKKGIQHLKHMMSDQSTDDGDEDRLAES